MAIGLLNQTSYSFANVTTNTTTTVKGSVGILHAIVINTPGTTETITIFDSTTGSGTKIGTITPTAAGTILYDATFVNGLTVVTAGTTAGDYTILWQ